MTDELSAEFAKLDAEVKFHASAVAKLVRENQGDTLAILELFEEVFHQQLQATDAAVPASKL